MRVDRDVFAAVADWDLDQSNCITLSLLLLSRHDDRESFLNRSLLESVLSAQQTTKADERSDEKLRTSKKEEKKTTKAKVV